MQKKIFLLTGIAVVTLLLTGCDGNVTRDIRHAGFNLASNEFTCNALMPVSDKIDSPDKILFTNSSFAITENGSLYELSLSQPYASEENCKKIDFSIKITAYMDDKILKGEDNKFYYAPGNSSSTALTEVTANDSSYQLYTILLGNEKVKKVITVDANAGRYYVLEDDGIVYEYKVVRQDYNTPYTLTSKTPVYGEKYGEIIDFNYAGESTSTYIKTKTAIYRMQIKNAKECTMYADIKCQYKMKKDETLTKYYQNKILYYGPNLLITTYGKEFTIN